MATFAPKDFINNVKICSREYTHDTYKNVFLYDVYHNNTYQESTATIFSQRFSKIDGVHPSISDSSTVSSLSFVSSESASGSS